MVGVLGYGSYSAVNGLMGKRMGWERYAVIQLAVASIHLFPASVSLTSPTRPLIKSRLRAAYFCPKCGMPDTVEGVLGE